MNLPPSLLSFIAPHLNTPFDFPPLIKELNARFYTDVTLPPSITSLDVTTLYTFPNWLACPLTRLNIAAHSVISSIFVPDSVTHFGLVNASGKEITLPSLSPNLHSLDVTDVSCAYEALPQSLQSLRVLRKQSYNVCPSLPPNITHLWLNGLLPTIPTTVTHLVIASKGIYETDFLDAPLPPSITHLQIYLKGDISQFLPPSLRFLSIEDNKDYYYPIDDFPDSIITMKINTTTEFTKLPKSLKVLCNKHSVELPDGLGHVKLVTEEDFPTLTETNWLDE